ncbi:MULTISPECIES: hypothetical protein [Methylorubrum]|jgi:hypothetical protein|uniref:hypothetical protein n=1 Tax=Methylorubrum TaxID=2282523 RepID=UPI00030653E8|nr:MULTISPECIES: hypothetical protein [Methylorubrum]MCP1542007.1 hypothetical protein [Methylorubrum extorquens]MCP1585456.1 hypothetical protein [Methylorubrum extorquens]
MVGLAARGERAFDRRLASSGEGTTAAEDADRGGFRPRHGMMLCPNTPPRAGDSGQSRRDVAAGFGMISDYRTTGRR